MGRGAEGRGRMICIRFRKCKNVWIRLDTEKNVHWSVHYVQSQEIYKRLPGAVGEGREVPKSLVSKRK